MFIQIIQGKVNDGDGFRQRFEKWGEELQSGAKGFLGTTGGITEDGTAIFLARFESEDAARANSDRPEQGKWWEETSKYFDGEPTFRDCSDVDTQLDGGSDDAGFVQVMQGRVRDRDRLRALEEEFMPQMTELRPDVIGSVRAWDGDFFTEAIYFKSEAEAREGESKMANETAQEFEEYMSLLEDVTYLDLKDPWLSSP